MLDYVGDEGNRKGYVSCTLFDRRHAQDWGLGEKRPPAIAFEPVVKRIEQPYEWRLRMSWRKRPPFPESSSIPPRPPHL